MSDWHSYEPREGTGLKHDPLPAILGPRPVAWISTLSVDGVPNVAPYSFFNVFNYKPPIVIFSSVGYKDSVRNAEQTGCFVYNLATRDLAERINATSAEVGADVDEFALVGLTQRPSTKVAAPAVAESPVSMECKVFEVKQMQDAQGQALDTWMVMAEVVAVHIDKRLLDEEGRYVTSRARPILRAGGPADYFEVTQDNLFQMFRPR